MVEKFLNYSKQIIQSFPGGTEIQVSSDLIKKATIELAKIMSHYNTENNLENIDLTANLVKENIKFLIENVFTIGELYRMLSVDASFVTIRPEIIKNNIAALRQLGFDMDTWKEIFRKYPETFGFKTERISQLKIEYNLSDEGIKQAILMYPNILTVKNDDLGKVILKIPKIIKDTSRMSQGLFDLETIYSVICRKSFAPMWKISELIIYILGKDSFDFKIEDDLEPARNAIIEQYPSLEGIEDLIASFKNQSGEGLKTFFEEQKSFHGSELHIESLNKKVKK